MQTTTVSTEQLAIRGGRPAVDEALPGSLQGVTEIGQEEIDAVTAVLKRKTMFRFLNSAEVSESARLEELFRKSLGVKHALALGGGGTGALICGLVGLGVGSGDEVLVPGYTYIATAAACLSVGAIPILVEVDESLTIDVKDAEKKITPYTKVILPVHMRGAICDMDPIMELAGRKGLKVLEDCAQGNGGKYRGRPVGSIGDVGAFSMQHYKAMTAGEGGMVTTNDQTVFRRAAVKHDSAMQFWKADGQWPAFAGENYRMCELRAALGLVQFGRLEGIVNRCRAVKRGLLRATAGLPGIRPQVFHDIDGDSGVIFAFFLESGDKARLFSEALAAEGVPNATIHNKQIPDRHIYTAWDYVMEKRTSDPTGWPWTAAHRPIEYRQDMLPNTLDVLDRCIAIGINQHWTEHHVAIVAGAIRKVAGALA